MFGSQGDREIALYFSENLVEKKWLLQNQCNSFDLLLLDKVFDSGFSEGRSGETIRAPNDSDNDSMEESTYNLDDKTLNKKEGNNDDDIIERRRVLKISEDYHVFS